MHPFIDACAFGMDGSANDKSLHLAFGQTKLRNKLRQFTLKPTCFVPEEKKSESAGADWDRRKAIHTNKSTFGK